MAKVTLPARTATVVLAGTVNDVVIGNNGSSPVALNTTSPATDGAAFTLGPHDSVAFAAGSAFAAATWFGWSEVGTVVVVTEP
jgi:hypothetical protein